ncbi:hypothetical protein MRX96_019166 [Rhipicephalus microplus]
MYTAAASTTATALGTPPHLSRAEDSYGAARSRRQAGISVRSAAVPGDPSDDKTLGGGCRKRSAHRTKAGPSPAVMVGPKFSRRFILLMRKAGASAALFGERFKRPRARQASSAPTKPCK